MALENLHEHFIKRRRAYVLHKKLCGLIPDGAVSILDIGCGDGDVAGHLIEAKPFATIAGIDTLVRCQTSIPVQKFDGETVPFESGAFDFSMLVDVLHHAGDPFRLLQEAVRVSKIGVIIKDHMVRGVLAKQTLRFMDNIHNRRFGVSLPYNYWTPGEWGDAFRKVRLKKSHYSDHLNLYPFWADWMFGRKLHFIGLFLKS